MRLADVVTTLEELAPLRYAESWDNVGLLVGDPRADIAKVLVTVDYTDAVADEAVRGGAMLVVAYHPPIFAPIKRVPHDTLWAEAVRRDIALYSPHTALDVAPGGTNDFLADVCEVSISERRAIRPFSRSAGEAGDSSPSLGLGRVGPIVTVPCRRLVERIKAKLGLDHVLASGPIDRDVASVAVAAGAGGELLEEAIATGANVFLTGEIRHHDALAASRRGVVVVATLHSNSERAAVRAYAARLAARLPNLEIASSAADRDPLAVV